MTEKRRWKVYLMNELCKWGEEMIAIIHFSHHFSQGESMNSLSCWKWNCQSFDQALQADKWTRKLISSLAIRQVLIFFCLEQPSIRLSPSWESTRVNFLAFVSISFGFILILPYKWAKFPDVQNAVFLALHRAMY